MRWFKLLVTNKPVFLSISAKHLVVSAAINLGPTNCSASVGIDGDLYSISHRFILWSFYLAVSICCLYSAHLDIIFADEINYRSVDSKVYKSNRTFALTRILSSEVLRKSEAFFQKPPGRAWFICYLLVVWKLEGRKRRFFQYKLKNACASSFETEDGEQKWLALTTPPSMRSGQKQ